VGPGLPSADPSVEITRGEIEKEIEGLSNTAVIT
jgi:hypothetical protein